MDNIYYHNIRNYNETIIDLIYQDYDSDKDIGFHQTTCPLDICRGYYLQVNIRKLVEKELVDDKRQYNYTNIKPITESLIEFFYPYYTQLNIKQQWETTHNLNHDIKIKFDEIIYKKTFKDFSKLYTKYMLALTL